MIDVTGSREIESGAAEKMMKKEGEIRLGKGWWGGGGCLHRIKEEELEVPSITPDHGFAVAENS